jgi:carboxymethylenebutenolidase
MVAQTVLDEPGIVESHSYTNAQTSWVDIEGGPRAFLAVPKRWKAPYPAVVLGHERYGLVTHTRDLAAKFASYGYVAIAPDMATDWNGDKAALMRGDVGLTLTEDQIKSYMGKSFDYLAGMDQVDATRVCAMGVCASGGYPHLLNSVRPGVAANIIFYGGVAPSDDVVAAITAPTLGVFGEKDHVISIEAVRKFRAKLEAQRKNYELRIFPDMPHGWLNDTMPGRYRQPQAEEAWIYMIRWLDRVFAGGYPDDVVRWAMSAEYSEDYDYSKNVRLA